MSRLLVLVRVTMVTSGTVFYHYSSKVTGVQKTAVFRYINETED